MLLWISKFLEQYIGAFRIFDYVTFRALLACLLSLFISLLFGNKVIGWLIKLKVGQSVRTDGPQTHLVKSGTPTMGGVMMLIAITITTLVLTNLSNLYIWIILFVLITTGIIGFADDYLKIVHKNPKGLPGKYKMLYQSIIALITGLFLLYIVKLPNTTTVIIPLFKSMKYPFGTIGFLILTYLVIVGSSNAVNLTDGLDGLVSFPIITVAIGLAVFAYIAGNKIFSGYLLFPHIKGATEIVVFASSIIGACMGFLWFNAHPAKVFMGDVGALSIGAALGTIAIILRQELVFAIMGGIFVIEALSVILQVGSYKLRKKRIFLMSPIHHHFELKGWKENQVVVRFWIVSIILLLIGLATIKLR